MKKSGKILLFLSGMLFSMAAAAAVLYKFFKKHCVIHIEFNPSEENSRACECDEDHCEICTPPEAEEEDGDGDDDADELEFELSTDEDA